MATMETAMAGVIRQEPSDTPAVLIVYRSRAAGLVLPRRVADYRVAAQHRSAAVVS